MSPTVPADPGLQPERTDLSWRRTHLSLVVAALAVARHPLAGDAPLLRVGAALVVTGLAAVLLVGRPRLGVSPLVTAGVTASLAVAEVVGILDAH